MSRRAKGPRLYLRTGRVHARTGQPVPDIYYIRDGSNEVSTGCGPDRLHGPEGAEGQLQAYIARKFAARTQAISGPDEAERRRDPAQVLIAEVLALYAAEKAPKVADPVSAGIRITTLLDFWTEGADGDETPRPLVLTDIRRSRCQAYVAWRTAQPLRSAKRGPALDKRVTPETARRELEDLSAAVAYWSGEHTLTSRPKVWLPPKPESPRDALSRPQAAALLRAAMGWRRAADGRWTRLGRPARGNRAHLRRFALIGLYTGSRPGVIGKLLWEESPTRAWVDLDEGVIYRRGRREADSATKRRPVVRIPKRLLAHLRRWRRMDLERMARRRAEGLPTTNAVIHRGGRPMLRLRHGYAAIVRDAGLPPEVTPHWQRHTCATWLMQRGAKLWEAASFAGMTVATLESCYGHHRPDYQSAASGALGQVRA